MLKHYSFYGEKVVALGYRGTLLKHIV